MAFDGHGVLILDRRRHTDSNGSPTPAQLRRSYRVVFVGYVAMLLFGLAAVIAAFTRALTANTTGAKAVRRRCPCAKY